MSKPHLIVPDGYTFAEAGNGDATKDNLRDPNCAVQWSTNDMTDLYLVVDRGAGADPCSGIGMFHTPATFTATRLIRSSDTLANLTGSTPGGPFARTIPAAGTDDFITNASDSAVQAAIKHWRHRSTLWINTTTPITERYVRIDLADAGLTEFYAGRLVLGVAELLPHYPQVRAEPPHFVQVRTRQESVSGSRTGVRSMRGRVVRFSVDSIETDALSLNRAFERRGTDLDLAFVWDNEHLHEHRYTFLGAFSEPPRPSIPHTSTQQLQFALEETFDPIG